MRLASLSALILASALLVQCGQPAPPAEGDFFAAYGCAIVCAYQ
jgi:hypothetical protein